MPQNKTKIYSARHSKHTHPEIGTLWSLLEVKQAILRDAQTDPQTHVCCAPKQYLLAGNRPHRWRVILGQSLATEDTRKKVSRKQIARNKFIP